MVETQPGAVVVHELNAMGYTQLALESQAKASLVQGYASARAAKLMAEVQASAIRPGCASLTFVAATERSLRSLFDGVHARPAEAFEPEGSAEWASAPERKKQRRNLGLPLCEWGAASGLAPKPDSEVAESLLDLSSSNGSRTNSTVNLSRAVSLLDEQDLEGLAATEAQFVRGLHAQASERLLPYQRPADWAPTPAAHLCESGDTQRWARAPFATFPSPILAPFEAGLDPPGGGLSAETL